MVQKKVNSFFLAISRANLPDIATALEFDGHPRQDHLIDCFDPAAGSAHVLGAGLAQFDEGKFIRKEGISSVVGLEFKLTLLG